MSFGCPLPPLELVKVQVQEQHRAAPGALVRMFIDAGPEIGARENGTCLPRSRIVRAPSEKREAAFVQAPCALEHRECIPRRRSHHGEVFTFPFVHGHIPSGVNRHGLSNGKASNREEVSRLLMRNNTKSCGEIHEPES